MENIMERKMCILEDNKVCDNCGDCNKCDLDPNKICDNCGKCLDEYNTDEKGFVKIFFYLVIFNFAFSFAFYCIHKRSVNFPFSLSSNFFTFANK